MKIKICLLVIVFSYLAKAADGQALFHKHCALCHNPGSEDHIPNTETMKKMGPKKILETMEASMSFAASTLNTEQKQALATFLSGKSATVEAEEEIPKSAFCQKDKSSSWDPSSRLKWNGWGANLENTRYQPLENAGISKDNVTRLKLKWAFGFPNSISARSQPALFGNRVYVTNQKNAYSLDAKSGCVHWIYKIKAKFRPPAISVGKSEIGFSVFLGDDSGTVHAVNAESGKLNWRLRVDDHPLARISGSPILDGNRLYVPVSSTEEGRADSPEYECCKFRGSVVAIAADSGKVLWKTYSISDEPKQRRKNLSGVWLWGPSGAAIWSSPTVDSEHQLIYVGTGNSYTFPVAKTSDAIIAFDSNSGKIKWSRQVTSGDVFIRACLKNDKSDLNSCSDEGRRDDDFAASPILVKLKGKKILLGAQKSGIIALEIDGKGPKKNLWEFRKTEKGLRERILWGPATDGKNVFVSTFAPRGNLPDRDIYGGLYALDLKTGKELWYTPAPACPEGVKPCITAQTAAVTVASDVVFSGSLDGHMRAYSSSDGKILWDFNSDVEIPTVNGIKARGGAFDGPGPTVVAGMLFVSAGHLNNYARLPGNVLLAFSAE